MALGEKLAGLRRKNNLTQEQFAQMLGVSRQSVSKWESDLAYPETEKLLRISEIFDCSLDYLLRDKEEELNTDNSDSAGKNAVQNNNTAVFPSIDLRKFCYEYKSKRTVKGIPLVHVNIGVGRKAKGIIAVGLAAKGVVAIGLASMGVVSLGFASLGVLSFGLAALGAVASAVLAAGIISFGAIALGFISFGAIAVGCVAAGGLALGQIAAGGLAIGKYFAAGGDARAMIAIGQQAAEGTLYSNMVENMTPAEWQNVRGMLEENLPSYLRWAVDFAVKMGSSIRSDV